MNFYQKNLYTFNYLIPRKWIIKINAITDDFIMREVSKGKKYTLVLLRAGANRNQSAEEADKIQIEHLRYLFKLRTEKKLLLNGPVLNDNSLAGIEIYFITDINEVKKLIEEDPGVKSGRLDYEVYEWFGMPGDNLV